MEYNDDGAEKGFQCPREATYVTEPIEKGVDFSSDNFSVTIQLVGYRQLDIVIKVIQSSLIVLNSEVLCFNFISCAKRAVLVK